MAEGYFIPGDSESVSQRRKIHVLNGRGFVFARARCFVRGVA